MSEKRFQYVWLNEADMISDKETEKEYYFNCANCVNDDVELIVDLLNNFVGDIKNLEEYSGDLENDLKRLLKENEQLKQALDKSE